MKNIIVPVDFSAPSVNAAAYAAGIANLYEAKLWLYHTYQLPLALPEYGYPLVTSAELQNAAEIELNGLAVDLIKKTGHLIEIGTKAELAYLHEGLTAFCDETKADLVVMGLSGKDALTRLVVGSNTLKAIHQLKYPVLVVPKNAKFVPVHRIGFACDYKKVQQSTPLELLVKMVKLFNAELHVINVDWHNRETRPDKPGEHFFMHKYFRDLQVQYHTVVSEDVTSGLNQFARDEQIDLLIAIPKRHNLVEKLFTVSKTQDLVYHTDLPVMCMHE
jgi:nucleotide-binding universal stress UspA family protein